MHAHIRRETILKITRIYLLGIAVEKAKKMGCKVEMVICGDDTTLLDQDTLAGPRGLCGVLFVQKIAGALAAQGHPLEAVHKVNIQGIQLSCF